MKPYFDHKPNLRNYNQTKPQLTSQPHPET